MTLALIDADILVYESAFRCQKADEWEPGNWTFTASMPEAQQDFGASVRSIMENTGADDRIIVLSESDRDNNFRRRVWPEYKQNRSSVASAKPLLYTALREWLVNDYDAKIVPTIEADDAIGIMATGDINGLPSVDDRIICSIDKDLDTIPGLHYNWRKSEDGVYAVWFEEANYNFMYQILCGDQTDGYPGLPGCGPKTAEKVLSEVISADSDYEYLTRLWLVVVNAFEKKGLTADDALIQARCARILREEDWDFDKKEVILWEPPTQ